MKKEQKNRVKDITIRAFKTFWQAAVGYAIANLAGINFCDGNATKTVLAGVVASALAAGLSAAWNGVISPLMSGGVKHE